MSPRRAFLLALVAGSVADTAMAAGSAPCHDERCDEPAPEECPTVQSVHDIDVPKALVRGSFQVNGQDPIPWDSQSARIELRSETLGVAELGALHEGGYDAFVVPGVYDVVYKHHGGTLVPANAESILVQDLVVTAGAYDFDVPSVLVMGDVTLNGGAFPASVYEHGTVRFRDVQTGASFQVGTSADGDYSALVMPGTYDVLWSYTNGNLVPRNDDVVLLEAVEIDQSAVIDVDVPVITVNGTFRINGAAPPQSIYENGRVSLLDPQTGDLVELGQTKDRTWSKRLVPGTYDVVYEKMQGGNIVPANPRVVIATGVTVGLVKSLTIDIPAVRLVGSFSLDGALFPPSIYENGKMWLIGDEIEDRIPLGETRNQDYDVRVVPGTYDVAYEVMQSNSIVPVNDWAVVSTGHRVSQPAWGGFAFAVLDVEVESGILSADATWWGNAFPPSIYENGEIRAVDADGNATHLFETRDGGGSQRLVMGYYDLHYSHWQGDAVPNNGDGAVGEGVASGFVMPAEVDVESGLLAGVFTQGGAPFPGLEDHYGRITLRDVQTGDRIELDATNEGGLYDLELLAGTYDVLYDHVEGNSVVQNVDANLGCVTFAPIDPYPAQGASRSIPNVSIQR